LLKDGFENAFDSHLQQLILGGRYPQRTELSIAFWYVNSPDVLGPIAFPFQFFHQLVNIAIQILLVFCRAHPVYAICCAFADVSPAISKHFFV
jgi:hypothetical protein